MPRTTCSTSGRTQSTERADTEPSARRTTICPSRRPWPSVSPSMAHDIHVLSGCDQIKHPTAQIPKYHSHAYGMIRCMEIERHVSA